MHQLSARVPRLSLARTSRQQFQTLGAKRARGWHKKSARFHAIQDNMCTIREKFCELFAVASHSSQTVSFGNISLFSLRQNISSYVTISPDYFQKCSGWLITITFYFTFYFVRRNSWGLQKLDKCHFLLAIMVLVFVFKLIKLSCFHLTICHFVLLTHSTLPALPGQNLYRWWWRKDLTRD